MEKELSKIIETRLHTQSISELKVLLDICKEKGKTSMIWEDRTKLIESVILTRIEYLFN